MMIFGQRLLVLSLFNWFAPASGQQREFATHKDLRSIYLKQKLGLKSHQ